MQLTVPDIEAALALAPFGARSDFDLNPHVVGDTAYQCTHRHAAVLCGLRERAGRLHVVLTRRAGHLRNHAGQVAFPGGCVDPTDASTRHAALREAEEEIGLPASKVRVLGTLDEYITSSGFHVTPFVGIVASDFRPEPDPGEVDLVFEPPLDFLMDPANQRRHHVMRDGKRLYYHAMPWNEHYIWGATAAMLKTLSDRLAAREKAPEAVTL
ncbi:MAG TPA: CoA pyrophosphatase [Paracoccaceae bacterium]|nr:CoA pyrophosphatase [Paracoccaceae bacterium]